jgi:hypothetical protein
MKSLKFELLKQKETGERALVCRYKESEQAEESFLAFKYSNFLKQKPSEKIQTINTIIQSMLDHAERKKTISFSEFNR